MKPPKARFIVLDGVEGCGKSTQARLLAEALQQQGVKVVLTHEPGGTAVGEAVRGLLLDPAFADMHELTETFLFCAARAQHLLEVIRPALESGKAVICDRFASSTYVYQGYAGGVGPEAVTALNDLATGGLQPDLLIVLDLDPSVGRRRKQSDATDRIEQKPLDFHQAVRDGFLDYAARLGGRAVVLDADLDATVLSERILALVWEQDAG
jgi:dTMP kinase